MIHVFKRINIHNYENTDFTFFLMNKKAIKVADNKTNMFF